MLCEWTKDLFIVFKHEFFRVHVSTTYMMAAIDLGEAYKRRSILISLAKQGWYPALIKLLTAKEIVKDCNKIYNCHEKFGLAYLCKT